MNISSFIATLSIMVVTCTTVVADAQSIPQATIASAVQKGKTVEFVVESLSPFYVGGNIFLLHIGSKVFHKYTQTDADGKGKLTYLIPEEEYLKLIDGDAVYLTYGILFGENKAGVDMQKICQDNPNAAKYLGVFTTKLLKR